MYSLLTNQKTLVLADQAVYSGCGFAITLLLVRILSPEAFGIYASIVLFNYLMVSASNALVIQPFQVIQSKVKTRSTYLSFTFFSQLIITAILLITTILLLQIEIEFLNNLNKSTSSILLLMSCFLLHDYFRKVFLAEAAVHKALVIDSITGFLQTTIFIYCLLNYELQLAQVFLISGVSYLPALLVSAIYLNPSFQNKENWSNYFQMHFKQGKWLLMTAILQWWANNLFVIASGVFLGAIALGALRLVQSIFGVLISVFSLL